MTTTNDIIEAPVRQLADAYGTERAKVNPPQGFRDDLHAPLRTMDEALMAADRLEARLANAVSGLREGRY